MTDWTDVPVLEHGFGLFDRGEFPIETADFSNGLIVTMATGAVIATGIHTGYVRVGVACSDTPPQDEGLHSDDAWDEIIEASVHAPHGRLRVAGYEKLVHGLPLLSSAGPGWYRVRAYARGRDTRWDAVLDDSDDPVEDYLIHVWPAEPAPTWIIRATDQCGAGMRLSATKSPSAANIHPDIARQQAEQQRRRDQLHEAILRGIGRLPPKQR